MEIPTKIKVAGYDIEIIRWNIFDGYKRQRFGEFCAADQSIAIDITLKPFKLVSTLIHEINHAIFWAYHLEDKDEEERIVSVFATAWTQVYRDNPDLLAFISKNLGVA